MSRIGHEEHGLDLGVEPLVHAHHLEFVFEIGNGAQAPHDHACAHFLRELDQKALEGLDRNRRPPIALKGGGFVAFVALFSAEEGRLGVVVTFMAVLELIKESLVELVQNEPFAPIHVRSRTE